MRLIRMQAAGVLCALALFGALGSTGATGAEYGIKGLPEIGRCPKLPRGTVGEYGHNCLKKHPGKGHYQWLPGPGAKPGFSFELAETSFVSPGATIVCGFANGEGKWTSEKQLEITKLVFKACENPAVSGEKTYCQSGEKADVIEATGLTGELGFIRKAKRPSSDIVGLDIAGTISFECENYVEVLSRAVPGIGVKREISGSAIGKITPFDTMVPKFSLEYTAEGSKQNPEKFEGREKDTLTSTVGSEKKTEPTALVARGEVKDEEELEVKAFCKGTGC